MSPAFAILAAITIAASVAAVSLRNLVHCALALSVAFLGLAAIYLQLEAQFAGFAQVLVYVGAVAILVVFAILLTRGAERVQGRLFSGSWPAGVAVAAAVLAVLAYAIARSPAANRPAAAVAQPTVRQIGDALMNRYVAPLEVAGLLLTAALIGAVIIAMQDDREEKK
jgi:NADH-quinone oxidoreductase subunit J